MQKNKANRCLTKVSEINEMACKNGKLKQIGNISYIIYNCKPYLNVNIFFLILKIYKKSEFSEY